MGITSAPSSVHPSGSPGTTRRTFLWLATVTAATTAFVAQGLEVFKGVSDPEDLLQKFLGASEKRRELLTRLFLCGIGGRLNMVASNRNLFWEDARQARTYDDAQAALDAIARILPVSPVYERCDSKDAYKTPGSIIVAGSQVSNAVSYDVLQQPQVRSDPFTLRFRNRILHLRYNFAMGGRDTLRRRLENEWKDEPNNEVLFRDHDPERSVLHDTREPATGILAFHRLPHPTRPDEVACLWTGNIGPATEATRLLFETEEYVSNSELQEILNEVAGAAYYQILFDVQAIRDDKDLGRHVPGEIQYRPGSVHRVEIEEIAGKRRQIGFKPK